MKMQNLKIRKAKLKDAESLASLSLEFGYQVTKDEIKNKIKRISLKDDQVIIVAEYNFVIGWMHISLVEPLESSSFVEIRGIVVNEQYRGKGIGTNLINSAVKWAAMKGCNKIRVRTNVKRTETREYYKKLGFISKKNQEVFEKTLN